MGRRAKYLTNTEKQEASHKNKEAYRKSEQYVFLLCSGFLTLADLPDSAKTLRVEQNRRAYIRRREAQKLTQALKLELPPIPNRMRQLALRHVPMNMPRYKRGYESDIPIEEDEDYAQFLHLPPYIISDELKEGGWARVGLIVQGKREKALKNLEIKRLTEQYNRQKRRTFCETLHSDILQHLDGWRDLCTAVDRMRSRYLCEWVTTMGLQILQWEARLVMNMIEDFESVRCEEEDDKYIQVFLKRWERR